MTSLLLRMCLHRPSCTFSIFYKYRHYYSLIPTTYPLLLVHSNNAASHNRPLPPPSVRFSSSKARADENLKELLEFEIDHAEAGIEPYEQDSAFPFEIIDNSWDHFITLKRKYSGENIQITVFLNLEEEEDRGGDGDVSIHENESRSFHTNVSLDMIIDKGTGSLLEFCCILNPEEIEIASMKLKNRDASDDRSLYEGPPFMDLDENLQSAFYRYLEERGIQSSILRFLQDYMIKKDGRGYLAWLKSTMEFIEK